MVLSGVSYAAEEVLRCGLKSKLNEPETRSEVEIDLDKKLLWVDGSKYSIFLVGERAIKAETDNGNVKISIDRFDGFMTLKVASTSLAGYCKKYNKLF